MRVTSLSASLALVAGVSALPQKMHGDITQVEAFPAVDPQVFKDLPKMKTPVPFEDAKVQFANTTRGSSPSTRATSNVVGRQTQCNPYTRVEWDSMAAGDRGNYINAIKCLMGNRPSGNYANSQSRWEDIVSVHQQMSGTIHSNDIFSFWHRYYTWTVEDIMRTECGFNGPMPWWDETKYTGNFPASSIFTPSYYGSLTEGSCVTDSQFSNAQSGGTPVVNLDIGPGSSDQSHCLSRDYDSNSAGQISSNYVSLCQSQGDYHSMGSCLEGGPHAYGHIAIGAVMNDLMASPGDPVFFLHHAFVDNVFYNWQYQDQNDRLNPGMVNGNDINGNPISASTPITVMGLRGDVTIGDLINPQGGFLCYTYQ